MKPKKYMQYEAKSNVDAVHGEIGLHISTLIGTK